MLWANDSSPREHNFHAKSKRWEGWLAHFKVVIWVLSITVAIALQPSTPMLHFSRLRSSKHVSKHTGEKARALLADDSLE